MATRNSDAAALLVCCDWSAHCVLLCADSGSGGRTSWRFLTDLEVRTAIPPAVCQFARETTATVEQTQLQAHRTLRSGVIGEYQQMLEAIAGLETQRARIMDRFESTKARPRRLRDEWKRAEQRRLRDADATLAALAQRAASGLLRSCYATLDDFLPDSGGVGAMLRAMHSDGELQPGQVTAGLSTSQRSDLMSWIQASSTPPPALAPLLDRLDRLVLALARHPELAADLAHTPLMRVESQCTCYPGGGSRYVRHTDDARQKQRKLTCIFYANPEWHVDKGGQLRLHLSTGAKAATSAHGSGSAIGRPADVDIAPLDNRLVLFWSDARVPHEVLSAYAPRYAVSVWYHDARHLGVPGTVRTDSPHESPGRLEP